jgi:hypothetical protein
VRIQTQQATFTAYFLGEQVVAYTQTGPLRDYYNDIQSLLGFPEVGGTERRRSSASGT